MARSRDPEPKKGSDSNKKQMATPRPTSTGVPRRESKTREERRAAAATPPPPTSTSETPRAAMATSEVARNRTADRKKERDKRERRQRSFAIIAGVVVVVVFVAFMFYVSVRPAEAPIPTDTPARYEGLSSSRTEQGYVRLGNTRASVQVSLYCDFDSEGCHTFHDQVLDQILQKVRTEDVSFTFVPLYGRIGNSEGASRAAVCAADQGGFWKMADALYSWLGLYGQVQAFTNNRILTGVSNLGLNRADFDGCIAGDRPAEIINAAVHESTGLTNFKGAPAVAVSGVLVVDDKNNTVTDAASVLAVIDRTLAQVKAAQSTAEPTAQATSEATAEATLSAGALSTAEATLSAAATSEATSAATVEAALPAATEVPTAEATAAVGGG